MENKKHVLNKEINHNIKFFAFWVVNNAASLVANNDGPFT